MLQPDRNLPPYRYVPGRAPHPLKHPDGHAFGQPEPDVTWPSPDAWSTSSQHRHAIDLFNAAYWWEAHEAWEVLWHLAPPDSPEHHALRGLIQSAAYRLKREMGHTRAAAVLLEKARMNLQMAVASTRLVLALDCAAIATSVDGDDNPVIKLEDGG